MYKKLLFVFVLANAVIDSPMYVIADHISNKC